jgi:hypothetical protein
MRGCRCKERYLRIQIIIIPESLNANAKQLTVFCCKFSTLHDMVAVEPSCAVTFSQANPEFPLLPLLPARIRGMLGERVIVSGDRW